MATSPPSVAVAQPGLDPAIGLRVATAFLAGASGTLYATSALSLPARAWPVALGGLALGAAMVAWAVGSLQRPGRAAQLAGVLLAVGTVGGSLLLVLAAGAAIVVAPGPVLQLVAQAALAVACLGGAALRSSRALRTLTGLALTVAAVTVSASFGGVAHIHPAERGGVVGGPPSTFLCHLV